MLSHTYGLEKRLLAAESEGLALSRNASIQADLFEAYLGGVQQQLGEAVAAAWIRGIIGPMIHLAYEDRKKASAKMEESKRELKQEKKANRPTRIKSGTVTPVGAPIEDMDEIVYPRNSCVTSDPRSRRSFWLTCPPLAPFCAHSPSTGCLLPRSLPALRTRPSRTRGRTSTQAPSTWTRSRWPSSRASRARTGKASRASASALAPLYTTAAYSLPDALTDELCCARPPWSRRLADKLLAHFNVEVRASPPTPWCANLPS